MNDLPEHVQRNRTLWNNWARQYVTAGEDAWAQETPTWGIWSVPESQVHMFPEDLTGKDVIELGLWDSLCLSVACQAGSTRRGDRQLRSPVGDRAPFAATLRTRFSTGARQRRGRTIP